jgi:hypothetical protein
MTVIYKHKGFDVPTNVIPNRDAPDFADKLKQWMDENQITTNGLAKLIGASYTGVKHWLDKDWPPSEDYFKRILKVVEKLKTNENLDDLAEQTLLNEATISQLVDRLRELGASEVTIAFKD